MRKINRNILAGLAVILILFAFSYVKDGAIQGKVVPEEGAQLVVAIAGTDTVSTQITSGSFMLTKLKPGTYTVWVKGIAPFKDTSVENVAVVEGTTTDVGEIKLLQ